VVAYEEDEDKAVAALLLLLSVLLKLLAVEVLLALPLASQVSSLQLERTSELSV
jgi:hypothetical protein